LSDHTITTSGRPKLQRLARWGKRLGSALLVVYLGFIFGFAPWWLAGRATRGSFRYDDKENAGLTPASFELPFEEVRFQAPDATPLDGWWVGAAQPKGSVVLVHGLNRSRIEMARKLPFLHAEGWNALLFDLRHHGKSGGDVSTFGALERTDVDAAVALAQQRSPGPVVVWGVSLGAASATLAAAAEPRHGGGVCDRSNRSQRDTVHHHLNLFRGFRWWLRIVPSWPVADEVVALIGYRGGFDPDAVDITQAAASIGARPCLFVCNSGDRRMPKDIAVELQAAAGPQAKLLVVPGDSHGGAWRDGTAAYETAVRALLHQVASR
jgi:pimeloyl-ACP methyl ester carboxylesterase